MTSGRLVADRYRLHEPVGTGGMGTVWRATDETTGTTVAAKHAAAGNDRFTDRLRREARLVSGIRHTNLVEVLDLVEDVDGPWLILGYVAAPTLALRCADGPIDPRRAARISAQVAAALTRLHAAGVVHRDVSPGNILVGERDAVRLTDFGISRSDMDITLTAEGMPAGVPAYFAPELAAGRAPSPASDVFALGAVLYWAVTGAALWGDDGLLATIRRAHTGKLPTFSATGPLEPVLTSMLRRRPSQRPTAARARDMLAVVAAGHPPRARRWLPLATTAVVALIAAGVSKLVTRNERPRPATTRSATASSPNAHGRPVRADLDHAR